MCHSNQLGTVFACPVSRLLADEGEVEYEVYESVDLTEKSARESATGNVMFGIPSNPKRDFDWQKIQSSKLQFCLRLFANMPQFFHHHQIDVAQRDGVRILLSMINADSYILHLAIDYAQNYAHISQVRVLFPLCLNILPSCYLFLSSFFPAYESTSMVQETQHCSSYHHCQLF